MQVRLLQRAVWQGLSARAWASSMRACWAGLAYMAAGSSGCLFGAYLAKPRIPDFFQCSPARLRLD